VRYTSDTGHPFDTDNRAYRRFMDVLGEHFDVLDWKRDDGRPVLTTLRDLASGDLFSVAIIDSLEMREPHALLTFTISAELTAHGPFENETTAAGYAPELVMDDSTIAASRPVPLHHPDQPCPPLDRWLPVPPALAEAARPALADAPGVALVLMDRSRHVLTAVGPFPHYNAADAWNAGDQGADANRLVVPLHAPRPATLGR
jgi:hypothetical protein